MPRTPPIKRCTQCQRHAETHIRFAPTVVSDRATLAYKQVVVCSLRCLRAWANGLEWRDEAAVAS